MWQQQLLLLGLLLLGITPIPVIARVSPLARARCAECDTIKPPDAPCICITPCHIHGLPDADQPLYPGKESSSTQQSDRGYAVPWCFNATIQSNHRFKPLVFPSYSTVAWVTDFQHASTLGRLRAECGDNGTCVSGVPLQVVADLERNRTSAVTADVLFETVAPIPGVFNRIETLRNLWHEYGYEAYLCSSPNCGAINTTHSSKNLLLILPAEFGSLAESCSSLPACTVPRTFIPASFSGIISSNASGNSPGRIQVYSNSQNYSQAVKSQSAEALSAQDKLSVWYDTACAMVLCANCVPLLLAVYRRCSGLRSPWTSIEVAQATTRCALCSFLLWSKAHLDTCAADGWPAVAWHFCFSLQVGYFVGLMATLLRDLTWPFGSNHRAVPPGWMTPLVACVVGVMVLVVVFSADRHTEAINNENEFLGQSKQNGTCALNPYSYTEWYSDFDNSMWLMCGMGAIAAVLCGTPYYVHGIAFMYACFFTLILVWCVKSSHIKNQSSFYPTEDILYQYGVDGVGLCWISDMQDGYNLPMLYAVYIPTAGVLLMSTVLLLFTWFALSRVKGFLFTEKKLIYLNNVTYSLMHESVVFGLVLYSFFVADYDAARQDLGTCNIAPGLILCTDLMLYAGLTAYGDVSRWLERNRDSTSDLNAELRVNLFSKLLEQIELEQQEEEEQPDSGTNGSSCCTDSGPSEHERNMFRQLRTFWGLDMDFRKTFKRLHQMSQRNEKSKDARHVLYAETDDHGGASGMRADGDAR